MPSLALLVSGGAAVAVAAAFGLQESPVAPSPAPDTFSARFEAVAVLSQTVNRDAKSSRLPQRAPGAHATGGGHRSDPAAGVTIAIKSGAFPGGPNMRRAIEPEPSAPARDGLRNDDAAERTPEPTPDGCESVFGPLGPKPPRFAGRCIADAQPGRGLPSTG